MNCARALRLTAVCASAALFSNERQGREPERIGKKRV